MMTQVCDGWLKNKCNRKNCKYLHKRVGLCKFFNQEQGCYKSQEECKYIHASSLPKLNVQSDQCTYLDSYQPTPRVKQNIGSSMNTDRTKGFQIQYKFAGKFGTLNGVLSNDSGANVMTRIAGNLAISKELKSTMYLKHKGKPLPMDDPCHLSQSDTVHVCMQDKGQTSRSECLKTFKFPSVEETELWNALKFSKALEKELAEQEEEALQMAIKLSEAEMVKTAAVEQLDDNDDSDTRGRDSDENKEMPHDTLTRPQEVVPPSVTRDPWTMQPFGTSPVTMSHDPWMQASEIMSPTDTIPPATLITQPFPISSTTLDCSICFFTISKSAEVALVPCGHTQYCKRCAFDMKKAGSCALCRIPVTEVLDLYF